MFLMAKEHCTLEEMAAILDTTPQLLDRRFIQVIKKGREAGKRSLRSLQWATAQAGSVPMQIWLGKQLLRQKEPKEEIEISEKDIADLFDNTRDITQK